MYLLPTNRNALLFILYLLVLITGVLEIFLVIYNLQDFWLPNVIFHSIAGFICSLCGLISGWMTWHHGGPYNQRSYLALNLLYILSFLVQVSALLLLLLDLIGASSVLLNLHLITSSVVKYSSKGSKSYQTFHKESITLITLSASTAIFSLVLILHSICRELSKSSSLESSISTPISQESSGHWLYKSSALSNRPLGTIQRSISRTLSRSVSFIREESDEEANVVLNNYRAVQIDDFVDGKSPTSSQRSYSFCSTSVNKEANEYELKDSCSRGTRKLTTTVNSRTKSYTVRLPRYVPPPKVPTILSIKNVVDDQTKGTRKFIPNSTLEAKNRIRSKSVRSVKRPKNPPPPPPLPITSDPSSHV